MTSAVVSLKRALRKELKTQLAAVPASTSTSECNQIVTDKSEIELTWIALAELVIQQLFNLEAYRNSRHISVYISLPTGEISTREIIHHILHNGILFAIFIVGGHTA